MGLQEILNEQRITKYHLSKISGIPKSTITDICLGKSSIEQCTAKTVQHLAKALNYSMEELMNIIMQSDYDRNTGLPNDKSYMECDLPVYLEKSIEQMVLAWMKIDSGEEYLRLDSDFCTLQSDINIAEVSNCISSEQAWYLREKYLRIEREV